MLVLARPFEQHRPAGDRARDERRFERSVVRTVVSVAAGARRMHDIHRLRVEPEDLRDPGPHRVDPLRMGPHREHRAGEAGERGRRSEGCVHLVGTLVYRPHRSRAVRRGPGHRFLARPALPHRKALAPVAEELVLYRAFVQSFRGGPLRRRGDPRGGPDRPVLVRVRYREEAPVTDEPRTFETGLEPVRKRRERPMVVRWPYHPGMQQVGKAKVMDETKRTGDRLAKAKGFDARHDGRRRTVRAERGVRIDGKGEGSALDQLAEAERPVRHAGANQPFVHLEGRRLDAKALRGPTNQLAPGGCRRDPNRLARVLHRVAAGGIAFVGRHAGPGRRHRNAVEGHAQLARGDERDRGPDPLTDVDLAGPHLDEPV